MADASAVSSEVGAGDHDIAAAALGLLTATYADSDRFGEVTLDYLSAMGSDTGRVIRLATGLTAVARVLIGMRQIETGASPEHILDELGRALQQFYPS
jgi:sugar/nucleoside kinase (ribokinase family)